jgi:tetratricopeptide (TPR) repeat protein
MVTALSALVEEYPGTYIFRYGLAAALESVGRHSEAIDEYRRALALRPGFSQAIVDFAVLLIQEGEVEEGHRQLQGFVGGPAWVGAPANLRAKALYGLALRDARRDSIASSLELLEESLRLAPGYPAARDFRAKIMSRPR